MKLSRELSLGDTEWEGQTERQVVNDTGELSTGNSIAQNCPVLAHRGRKWKRSVS